VWRYDYRLDGKRRTASFGGYPEVSLADARGRHGDARELVASGVDPVEHKREILRPASNRFEDVAREWHEARQPKWTARYAGIVIRRLERDIFPQIGDRDIGSLEPADMLKTMRSIEGRGAVDVAARLRTVCGEIFRFAIADGRARRDPTADIRGALKSRPPKKRRAAVKPAEMGQFLVGLSNYDGDEVTRLALRLTVLTMVRTTETRFALVHEFEDLDGPAPLWRIPAARMKMRSEHLVPLSRQAAAVVKAIIALTGATGMLFARRTVSGTMSRTPCWPRCGAWVSRTRDRPRLPRHRVDRAE
jgi:integrase